MVEIEAVKNFINENIAGFHRSRISAIGKLQFESVIKRKNPYLFRAKNIITAEDFVKTLIDAYLSSQEETLFGEFLEKLAIFVCGEAKGGYKSGIEGIDLEIAEGKTRYIITIKSGPNWGNSGQISKMKDNFTKAQKILRTQNSEINVIPINGCCYGRDNVPDKGLYFKYCGQSFWELITDIPTFYIDIIEPLGYKAKEKNDMFYLEYSKVINRFTKNFLNDFCFQDGGINWERIVEYNSSRKKSKENELK